MKKIITTTAAAQAWIARTPHDKRPRPLVPYLSTRFGLSPVEACRAIRAASGDKPVEANA